MIVAGLDVGNQTTELVVAEVGRDGSIAWHAASLARTSGIKGSRASLAAALALLEAATPRTERVLVAELVPAVTGQLSFEAVTSGGGRLSALRARGRTPGGSGLAAGKLVGLVGLARAVAGGERLPDGPLIVAVPLEVEFDRAAATIDTALRAGLPVAGVVCTGDDAVVIANRLSVALPIVDEVDRLDLLPAGCRVALEVAPPGRTVQRLADPLYLADHFGFGDASAVAQLVEAERCALITDAPLDDAPERRGRLTLRLTDGTARSVDLGAGAAAFAEALPAGTLADLASDDPAVAALLARTPRPVRDAFAVGTPRLGETWLHRGGRAAGVALALLGGAPADRFPELLAEACGLPVEVVGGEAEAAFAGGMTTPGATTGAAVCDVGAGTIDLVADGRSVVAAGAGDLVVAALAAYAGLPAALAESAKLHPVVAVIEPRLVLDERGTRRFLADPAPPAAVGGLALDTREGIVPLPGVEVAVETFAATRRALKRDVLGRNVARCLSALDAHPDQLILAGGGALDEEVVAAIGAALGAPSGPAGPRGPAIGRANVAGRFGPRAAVAAGLVVRWAEHAAR